MCNSCFDVLGSLLYNTWSCDYNDGVPFPGQFHSSVSGWSHANILLLVWRGSGVPSRIFVRQFAIDIIWQNVHKYWMLIEGMQNLVSQQLFVQRDSLSHFCQLFCAYTKSKNTVVQHQILFHHSRGPGNESVGWSGNWEWNLTWWNGATQSFVYTLENNVQRHRVCKSAYKAQLASGLPNL